MIIDGFSHQIPDADPQETAEWLESLDAVTAHGGPTRARFIMAKLVERARQLNVGVPGTISTPYINTIPPNEEPFYPGDELLEKRIRRFIRWNAAVMVINANHEEPGIGGHPLEPHARVDVAGGERRPRAETSHQLTMDESVSGKM